MVKIAVIKTGGKQYLVKENDKIKVEKLAEADGSKIELETLLVADGEKVEMGEPTLAAKVMAKILGQGRADKVTGIKYKRKTRYRKKFGHRQCFTEIMIEKI
ncbi:MAG: 50S ribosomal protein L21 [Patescibacteria group bacterium]|jgi:large subunit ribosomal protein L21